VVGTVSERELWEAWFAALDKALALQAHEYERRLEDLNGEASRLHTVMSMTVNREVFDKVQDADRDWKSRADKWMSENAGQDKGSESARFNLNSVLILLCTGTMIALEVWRILRAT